MNREEILNMIACHIIQVNHLKLQRDEECKLITDKEQHDIISKTYNDEINDYNDDIKELQSKL